MRCGRLAASARTPPAHSPADVLAQFSEEAETSTDAVTADPDGVYGNGGCSADGGREGEYDTVVKARPPAAGTVYGLHRRGSARPVEALYGLRSSLASELGVDEDADSDGDDGEEVMFSTMRKGGGHTRTLKKVLRVLRRR